MNFDELTKKRRSVRHYTDETVSLNLLIQLIKASVFAPVSCNLQTTKYIILNKTSTLCTLTKQVSSKFGYSRTHILVLNDSRFLVGRYSGVMSAGMAVENVVLKATELGLSTCVMAGFGGDNKIKKILSIPSYMDILLLISVGFENKNFKKSDIPKVDLKERFSVNSYGALQSINDSQNLEDHTVTSIIDYRRRIAPVYLDSFRLNSYDNRYYDLVFNHFKEKILVGKKNLTILDLMSYDGLFVKLLCENNLNVTNRIICSDYLENNTSFLKNKFEIESLIINKENKFDLMFPSVDITTFIFGFSFTPQIDLLLQELDRRMKNGSVFFLANISESIINRIYKKIRNFCLEFILNKKINIYENNQFYKIGPRQHFSNRKIISICKNYGFELDGEIIMKKQNKGVSINMFSFKKIR